MRNSLFRAFSICHLDQRPTRSMDNRSDRFLIACGDRRSWVAPAMTNEKCQMTNGKSAFLMFRSLYQHPPVFSLMLGYLKQNEAAHRHACGLHRCRLRFHHRSDAPLRFQKPSLVSHKRNSAWIFIHLLPPGSKPAPTHNYILPAEHARQPRPLCTFGHSVAADRQSLPHLEASAIVCAASVFKY